ncbi:MAG: hypothetical protein JRF65_04595 [Deltaproteobacteria bacterium]|nr:hypothetical protein [Deltaproteobacteria bacterium]
MNSSSTEPRQIRRFGLVAFLFFGTLAGLGFWRDKTALACFFSILSSAGFGLLLLPGPLRPVYSGWLKVAHLIGKIITGAVLALAYYLVITPSGLLKRVFGGRPLPLRPDRKAFTYWVQREETAQPKERFTKRF